MEKILFEDLDDIEKQMLEKAKAVMRNAYATYSDFKVGASVLSENVNIYAGCNVESVDLTLTTHAEMNAIDTMVAQGERKIKKILVVMYADSGYGMPCGLCRQKILEFADGKVEILGVTLNKIGEIKDIFRTDLKEILPYPFGPEYSGKN